MKTIIVAIVLISSFALAKEECGHVTSIKLREGHGHLSESCSAIFTDNPTLQVRCPSTSAISLAQTSMLLNTLFCYNFIDHGLMGGSIDETTIQR